MHDTLHTRVTLRLKPDRRALPRDFDGDGADLAAAYARVHQAARDYQAARVALKLALARATAEGADLAAAAPVR